MNSLHDAQIRSALMSVRIQERTDCILRDLIAKLEGELEYHPLEDLMISKQAWDHISRSDIDPKFVFANPVVLREYPQLSQYYRGIALLPQKWVADIAGSVTSWEDGTRKTPITESQSTCVARLYNAVICSIIEGTSKWTLNDGYRNIIANMGIGLDGTFRNIIGQDAEDLVKTRIRNWLGSRHLIIKQNDAETEFQLPDGYLMCYGSEPDILFRHELSGTIRDVATIEIKGGKDPAGALERLGAMQKSFEATPPGCINILIAGGTTAEMKSRLDQMGVNKVFLLDDLAYDGESWNDFTNEVFHYTIRIT